MMKLLFRLPASLREHLWQYVESPRFSSIPQSSDADSLDTLLQHNEKPLPRAASWHNFRAWTRRRPFLFFLLPVLLFLFFSLGILRHRARYPLDAGEITHDPQFLYLVIPTPKPTTDTCKTLLSAQILNYPTPWLVQWDTTLDAEKRDFAKLSQIAHFLSELPKSAQNATVIVLDEPGAWFQLRPEVLLKRYYDITRRANQALKERVGKAAFDAEELEQTVLFAAQNACEKGFLDNDTSCYAVPPSPVPDGPRYMNLGTAIGPVKHMSAIYNRAVLTAAQSSEKDMHKIFASMFGQQEFQREVIRQRHWSWARRAWHSFALPFGRDATILDYNVGYQRMDYFNGKPCEFGMGLDYDSHMTFSTVDGVDAMAWEQHGPSHVGLAADIKESMPPFWTVGDETLPTTSTWGDVELLTNTHSNIVPAVVSHSTQHDKLNEKWWKHVWFQRHARQLFSDTVFLPASIVANFVDQTAGVERSFWHPKTTMARAGLRNAEDGKFVHWQEICGAEDTATELFRDGKGVWQEPAH